jgi:hypothetical protein
MDRVTDTKAKVLVATPNYSNTYSAEVHVNHMECAVAWTKAGIDYSWIVQGRNFVHFARSNACHVALLGNYTHILWLDDDAIIDPALLPRYLAHDKEVIVTPYFMRRPPFECGILKSTTGDFHDHRSYVNLTHKDLHQGLIEIDGGGTHAMLMQTAVLMQHGDPVAPEAMDAKLRAFLESLDGETKRLIDHHIGTTPNEAHSLQDENDKGLRAYFIMPKYGTEDMLFCYRLKRKGVRIWCDTDATAGHVGFAPVVTEALHVKAQEMLAREKVGPTMQEPPQAAVILRVPPHDIKATPDSAGVSSMRREGLDRSLTASLV